MTDGEAGGLSLAPGIRRVRLAEFRRDSLWLRPAVATVVAWAVADNRVQTLTVLREQCTSATAEICRELLGLDDEEIARLVEAGALDALATGAETSAIRSPRGLRRDA